MPRNRITNASDSRAGGAATAAGVRYQGQVTAWWAAHVLLQSIDIVTEYDLPTTAMATRIYCETTDAVDDLRIECTDSVIFGQCKRSLRRSTQPGSEFGSVFAQFLRELGRDSSANAQRRFVLFYEQHNSKVRQLGSILNRYRTLDEGTALARAASNQDEAGIISDLDRLLDALLSAPEFAGMVQQRESLLKRFRSGGGVKHREKGHHEAR